MRMIFLALLVFLFAGASIAVSRLDLISVAQAKLQSATVDIAFEPEPAPQEVGRTVSLHRSRPDGVLLLGGTSVAQSVQFPMLRDATVTGGHLRLRATSQNVQDHGSVLKVYIGNRLRGELLLTSGTQVIDTDIGLTSDDLAADTLNVRYVLDTEDHQSGCLRSDSLSTLVEIEQGSQIQLDVEHPRLSPRDQYASWGETVLVGWPNWLPVDQRQERAALAMELAVLGYRVRYVDAPNSQTLSVEAMRSLIADGVPVSEPLTIQPDWPELVSDAGANAGMRKFNEETTWRHWYRIGPNGHASAPSAFEYELLLGSLPADAHWTVLIVHNGSLIDVQERPGTLQTLSGRVSLADVPMGQNNSIEVTAVSSYEPVGQCGDGPELIAELRPTTQLMGGGARFESGLDDIKQALAQREPLSIGFDFEMSIVEMQRINDLVSALAPTGHKLQFSKDAAIIAPVRRADFDQRLLAHPDHAFVAWMDDTDKVSATTLRALRNGEGPVPEGALMLIVNSDASTHQSQAQLYVQ